jgi:hypothetical protein
VICYREPRESCMVPAIINHRFWLAMMKKATAPRDIVCSVEMEKICLTTPIPRPRLYHYRLTNNFEGLAKMDG